MEFSKNIIRQIDEQLGYLHRTRAVFPFLPETLNGEKRFVTAPYYQGMGFTYIFEFATPLTLDFIKSHNDLAHWINQNFVVRLYAVLESNGLISQAIQIRPDLQGHEEVDIVRRLRNQFGHGPGNYDPTDPEKKKLFDRIRTYFNLSNEEISRSEGKFPLPINQVLVPLAEGCKRYAAEVERTENQIPN
jgi:hypothetical protein